MSSPRLLLVLTALAVAAPAQQYEWRKTETVAFSTSGGVMAWDARRHRVVCQAGSETWECDGARWRLRARHQLSSLMQPGLAYDRARGVTWMFGGSSGGGYASQTWRWDGSAWTQVQPATTPPGRWFSPLAYDVARQRVVMYAGESTTLLNDMWEFDGVNWTRLFPATMPTATSRHQLAYDEARGVTVLFGGVAPLGNTPLAETWEWNGVTWTRRSPVQSPPGRRNHGMTYDALRARTVVFGGYVGSASTIAYDTWEYDGVTWRQHPVNLPAPAQVTHHLGHDPDHGGVLCVETRTSGNRTWLFDGASWRVVLVEQCPGVSDRQPMAFDPLRGETVLYGQSAWFVFPTMPQQTWVNRGGAWTRRSPPNSPPDLLFAAMSFDPAGSGMLLFGGLGFTPASNVTWLWNGSDWRPAQPATVPPGRLHTALVADLGRARVVMFGGDNGSGGALGDTWEWDGANWTQRLPASSPPPREGHAMTWDPLRGRTVLFGGGDWQFTPTLGDHWEWDGNVWTQVTVALPPPRSQHSLVFDLAAGKVLLLGGQFLNSPAFGTPRNDAWLWDGNVWQQLVNVTGAPPARRNTPAVHDQVLRRTLLFGGEGDLDTWLLGPVSPARVTAYGIGCPGSFGLPEVRAVGEPFVGNVAFGVQLSALPPGAFALLGVGTSQANVALGGGCTLLTGQPSWLTGVADARGAADVAIPIPNLAQLRGLTAFAQAVALDGNGAFSGLASLSVGLRIVLD